MIRRVLYLLLCLMMLPCVESIADDEAVHARSLCAEIERYVDGVVDYTDTTCLPSPGGKEHTLAFIILAQQPIFSVEASKKAWLMVVVGAIGKVVANHKPYDVSEMYVGDVNLVKNRKAFWLPGSVTKGPLKNVQDGLITLDEFYAHIQREMKEKKMPQSPQGGA